MKKLLFFVLCLLMSVVTSATVSDVYSFEYEDAGITVMFDENTNITAEKRQHIADYLVVYGESNSENLSTYAWCWLTGHDIVNDSVITITHKVSADAPRCRQTIYLVDTCSNCDYVETTELSSVYIDCCPED